MERFFLIFILLLLPFGIFSQTFVDQLKNISDFENLSGLPLSDKYGQVSALKLVYELKTKKIYYLNSRYFRYHHEFCGKELEQDVELEYFNEVNYSNDSRKKYLLANINYYPSFETYALEISPVDLMSQDDILLLWNLVSKTTYIKDSIHLLINSSRLQNLSAVFDEKKVPILNPSDIYRNLDYQAIGKFKKCGILRYISDLESQKADINPKDIVVINETPLFLPEVSGIIVSEFQTPLSHLTILGQNRKIPIAAYKLALEDSTLLKLNGQKVCFEVLSDKFVMYPIDKLKNSKQIRKPIKLKYDLEVDSIVGIENLNRKSYKYAGNKAGNFGILYQLSKKHDFKVPEGSFVIPFYFYNQHIINSNTKHIIDDLLARKNDINNKDSLKQMLKSIRKAINSATVDSVLLQSINHKVIANGDYTRLRFRSSTNAEDAKGFSGAGLYTSKSGILYDDKKSFEKAIKKVWASLWSFKAYSEREYYNINHQAAYMGVLVHRSFPSEEVNGVAITKNLYRPDSYGFVVNAQLGNESVVKPKQLVVCDQFICYPDNANTIYKNKNTIDIITQSSLNNDKLVMTDEEIQKLANQLEIVKKYFKRHTAKSKSYLKFGLDVEFKLDEKGRELYFKQVRLYND